MNFSLYLKTKTNIMKYLQRLGYTTEVQMSELGQPKGRGNVNTSYIADKNRMKTKVM
jgi:hypothetical protein